MSSTIETPMLFLPPQPPVALGPHMTVVLGRSRSCDLRLSSKDASRRHAEIVAVTGGFVVRDLGSTNGTFVNGERVEERQLKPGDRIQIGSNTVTFCHVSSALDGMLAEHGEEQTLLVERPAVSETFQGDLAEIPPFAVVQILEMGRKSGVLHIETPEGAGCLWLREGMPVHAEVKGQSGFDAALSIVDTSAGRFSFEASVESPEQTIRASVTELLLEASRLQDERDLF